MGGGAGKGHGDCLPLLCALYLTKALVRFVLLSVGLFFPPLGEETAKTIPLAVNIK